LVVNTAKYLTAQPILALNPDPQRVDGMLIPFAVEEAGEWAARAAAGPAAVREVTMAQAALNDGQVLYAFNDLFLGPRSHVSARYRIEYAGRAEDHSSSGLIVSTGAGSTGWLSSVFQMVSGVATWAGGAPLRPLRFEWEDPRLVFVVREPFVSRHSSASIVTDVIAPGEHLVVESAMPVGGVIFSDGVEADHLAFDSGATVTIGAAPEAAHLVVA
jgi:hypothetical protein